MVTLMAVSDRLRLSDWLAHCLGPVLRSCFSEVMSFWDLESSRKQTQRMTGGCMRLCRDLWEPSLAIPATTRGRPKVPGGQVNRGVSIACAQRQASGPGGARTHRGVPRHWVLGEGPIGRCTGRRAGFLKGDCVATHLCGLRATVREGVPGRASQPGCSAFWPHVRRYHCPNTEKAA